MTAYEIDDEGFLISYTGEWEVCEAEEALFPGSVLSSALPFFDDKYAKKSAWFHATTNPNWHETVTTATPIPFVHVGTRRAALHRSYQMSRIETWKKDPWFLYKLELTPDAPLHPEVNSDHNEYAPRFVGHFDENDMKRMSYSSVTRYINDYESIGSISLIADPRFLKVVSMEPIRSYDSAR